MIICDICTGRHRTGACGKVAVFVEQCFAGTPDDFDPATVVLRQHVENTALEAEFERRRAAVAAERTAWEAERDERRRVAANQRTLRYRTRLRLVS